MPIAPVCRTGRERVSAQSDLIYCSVMISEPKAPHDGAISPDGRMASPWTAPLASRSSRGEHAADIARIVARVEDGERIDREEALTLHDHADTLTLGFL